MRARDWIRRCALSTGYRVTALPPNRFEGQAHGLRQLRARGFAPRIVIDAGANVGDWTAMARPIFPDAEFHLIEPQPACAEALNRIDAVRVHNVAVTRPGTSFVHMADAAGSSGAWVADGHPEAVSGLAVPATTLDALFAGVVTAVQRPLMKLDLEGHELAALEGAGSLLPAVEVVVTEVLFYDVDRRGFVTFAEVLQFLRERGFQLYDVLSLHSRRRDGRLRTGDAMFVRLDSAILADAGWG